MDRVSAPCAPSIDRLQSTRPIMLDHGHQCVSPHLLNYGLQAHVQTGSFMASKCISKVTRLQPPNSYYNDLQVHLQTNSLAASYYMINLVQWMRSRLHNCRIQVYLYTQSITISQCISMFTLSSSPSLTPNMLGYQFLVQLHIHSIMALDFTSEFTW